jgi:hypothetical protein
VTDAESQEKLNVASDGEAGAEGLRQAGDAPPVAATEADTVSAAAEEASTAEG